MIDLSIADGRFLYQRIGQRIIRIVAQVDGNISLRRQVVARGVPSYHNRHQHIRKTRFRFAQFCFLIRSIPHPSCRYHGIVQSLRGKSIIVDGVIPPPLRQIIMHILQRRPLPEIALQIHAVVFAAAVESRIRPRCIVVPALPTQKVTLTRPQLKHLSGIVVYSRFVCVHALASVCIDVCIAHTRLRCKFHFARRGAALLVQEYHHRIDPIGLFVGERLYQSVRAGQVSVIPRSRQFHPCSALVYFLVFGAHGQPFALLVVKICGVRHTVQTILRPCHQSLSPDGALAHLVALEVV